MFRFSYLLAGLSKSDKGLEIAPYHSPLAPKRDGHNCLVLDVFDSETLRLKGNKDKNVPQERIQDIEKVDFVGSATELEHLIPKDMHGSFKYIVSSHNFEHLANPIRFLQACEKILMPGGVVRMAVPDARACFDYYRPVTLLSDWLCAYGESRERPTREQVFSLAAYASIYERRRGEAIAFQVGNSIDKITVKGDLRAAYQNWLDAATGGDYQDTHCTVMTPGSLRLLLEECIQLGLIDMRIVSISTTYGHEFFVKLEKPENGPAKLGDDAVFHKRRTVLLREIMKERYLPKFNVPFVRKLRRFGFKIRARLGLVG